ncbi:tyrosine-type recombinase/integrase [Nonomuraea sp. NPDC046802]|uniref:tyrosine-type recombinase/integrase n=1 Tax=Nonomuraea sp. NPDC046802 TaxID=3154919 RepID=UPI0033D035B1
MVALPRQAQGPGDSRCDDQTPSTHPPRPGTRRQDRRHTLELPKLAAEALRQHHVSQAARKITKAAGLGTAWSPRELRHSFVSIMSDQGVPIETIADLVAGLIVSQG